MNFLKSFFKNEPTQKKIISRLHQKMEKLLPHCDEARQTKLACMAGVLARVAYADMDISESEQKKMIQTLQEWTALPCPEIKAIVELASTEMVDLVSLENTNYSHPLGEIMSSSEKFEFLKALFALAASDGEVEHVESEEIRLIAQALLLEHKHYIAARATVLNELKALKR